MNIRDINTLEYRRKVGDEFQTFYYFSVLDKSSIYCRRECEYFVHEGTVYEKIASVLEKEAFIIYVQESETELPYDNAHNQDNLCVEVREYHEKGIRNILVTYECVNHEDVLGYLGNTHMVIGGMEYEVTSKETDQDRNTYVIYVLPPYELREIE